ncbi:MAG: hypothetical protein NC180_03630 [Muribaculaceae bacterium]|nr:hypothetical protein [Roseburia sp.]MCM1431217.1 hypothetical protein [Muribaculaceae bacterium]MCM1492297.1 hypothetical protein [Muribaculaceae bacterium]
MIVCGQKIEELIPALDNETEAAIMESINALHGKKTMIIIAHRLTTIEECDMVYRVEDGKICRER